MTVQRVYPATVEGCIKEINLLQDIIDGMATRIATQSDMLTKLAEHTSRPPGEEVRILYTNWRGETAWRRILPLAIGFEVLSWHPEPQWVMHALDADKGVELAFAIKGIYRWEQPNLGHDLPQDYMQPETVTLCGSTRFKPIYTKASRDATLAGLMVYSVGLFGHLEGLDMGGDIKNDLDRLHLRKIDRSQRVWVLNGQMPYCQKCGVFRTTLSCCPAECRWDGVSRPYIGESTKREIAYATSAGRRIQWLYPEGGQEGIYDSTGQVIR